MPKYQIQWKAELNNLTDIVPASKEDFEWHFKIMCTKCHEIHATPVVIRGSDQVEMHNSRGTTHFLMKCKFCSCEGSIDLDMSSLVPLKESETFTPLLTLEGRGLEPVEWIPTVIFIHVDWI